MSSSPSTSHLPLVTDSSSDQTAPLPPQLKGSSVTSAAFNLANAALGAGVLLFPSLYASLGLLLAIGAYFFVTLVMSLALTVLSRGAELTRQPSYQGVMRRLISDKISVVIEVSMTLYLLGSCVSFLVVVVDMVGAVFLDPDEGEMDFTIRFGVATGSCLLILPLMLLKDVEKLELGSFAGVIVNLFAAIVIALESLNVIINEHGGKVHEGFELYYKEGVGFKEIASAMSTYTFSNEMTLVFIPVYFTLENRTPRNGNISGMLAFFLCFICYFSCGCLGYMAYGPDVASDILAKDLPPKALATNIARVCLALKSFVHYPLVHFPARLCLLDMMMGVRKKMGWTLVKENYCHSSRPQHQFRRNTGSAEISSELVLGPGGVTVSLAENINSSNTATEIQTTNNVPLVSNSNGNAAAAASGSMGLLTDSTEKRPSRLSIALKHQFAVHCVARNNIFRAKHSSMKRHHLEVPAAANEVADISGALYSLDNLNQNSQQQQHTQSSYTRAVARRVEAAASGKLSLNDSARSFGSMARLPMASMSFDGIAGGGSLDMSGVFNNPAESGTLQTTTRTEQQSEEDSNILDLDTAPSFDFYFATFLFLLTTWALTILFTDLGRLIDLVSALFGVPQVYLYPGLGLIAMARMGEENGKSSSTGGGIRKKNSITSRILEYAGGVVLVGFGLFISVMSVWAQIDSL